MTDRNSFLELICSCTSLTDAARLHSQVQHWISWDVFVANKVVEMYGRCGSAAHSRRVFDEIRCKDCFSWVLMLCSYAGNECPSEAQQIFDEMPAWNVVAWTALLNMYARSGAIQQAERVYHAMAEHDSVSVLVMLWAYAQRGYVEQSKHVFDGLEDKTLSLWNAMVTTFGNNRSIEEARRVFDEMPQRDLVSWNALVAAYVQSGQLRVAEAVFQAMPERDVVSWTAIICANAHAGEAQVALQLFNTMTLVEVADAVCMVGVLVAATHKGRLPPACSCFASMSSDFGVLPTGQHYSCIISLLCRAGYVADADELMSTMPFAPTATDWRCFLAACRCYNVTTARGVLASTAALRSEPDVASPYVMLSDIWRAR